MPDYAALESHADTGLGADEPGIHRFTRAVELAEARALADHRAGRCSASEWSCAHCEADDRTEDLRPLNANDPGDCANSAGADVRTQ